MYLHFECNILEKFLFKNELNFVSHCINNADIRLKCEGKVKRTSESVKKCGLLISQC